MSRESGGVYFWSVKDVNCTSCTIVKRPGRETTATERLGISKDLKRKWDAAVSAQGVEGVVCEKCLCFLKKILLTQLQLPLHWEILGQQDDGSCPSHHAWPSLASGKALPVGPFICSLALTCNVFWSFFAVIPIIWVQDAKGCATPALISALASWLHTT